MRIIAIGIGGAGCRIVDSLYSADRRGSKVACVQALAVDVTEDLLKGLRSLPDSNKLFYPPADEGISGTGAGPESAATIDIAEITARINNFEAAENDALLLCLGLGGTMADVAPHIITSLRSSVTEPIFALVTLPCLAEGEKRSARAADQIDILSPLLDGMILFDNETWYKKTKAQKAALKTAEKGLIHRLGLAKAEPELSGEEATYHLINQAIVRRISLILKAGEFRADGGLDMAEVVLDSGEVLNTLKGMGFITIGYAVERLPSNPLAFLAQFRPKGVFDEENRKRASRIVDLAKQAIYHEISTPCDMTSAHKALVLIAGPSHELSMKGFMTVRKWIDRSIAGLEMRSGDYPVMNTKNVAIIVMLSGLENIPRVTELREIRAQYLAWSNRSRSAGDSPVERTDGETASGVPIASVRDEMIVLPAKMRKSPEPIQPRMEKTPSASAESMAEPAQHAKMEVREIPPAAPPVSPVKMPVRVPDRDSGAPKESRRIITTRKDQAPVSPPRQVQPKKAHETSSVHHAPAAREPGRDQIPLPPRIPPATDKDAARQRIELELQKQRLKAISGKGKGHAAPIPPRQASSDTGETPHRVTIRSKSASHEETVPVSESGPEPEPKTVIIAKRKVVTRSEVIKPDEDTTSSDTQKPHTLPLPPSPYPDDDDGTRDRMTVEIRDTPFRAKDQVFKGRDVQKPEIAAARDASLLHTSLRPKESIHAASDKKTPEVLTEEQEPESSESHSRHKRKESR